MDQMIQLYILYKSIENGNAASKHDQTASIQWRINIMFNRWLLPSFQHKYMRKLGYWKYMLWNIDTNLSNRWGFLPCSWRSHNIWPTHNMANAIGKLRWSIYTPFMYLKMNHEVEMNWHNHFPLDHVILVPLPVPMPRNTKTNLW